MDIFRSAVALLLVINLISFCLFGIDKRRALQGKWRISEARLLICAALGGSIGAMAGMYFFHHKTRKNKFRIGVPMLLLFQVLGFAFLMNGGFQYLTSFLAYGKFI